MLAKKDTNLSSPRKLLTVRQWTKKHEAFSEGGTRYYIFNAESNGLMASGALIRLGRRVLIDEEKFFQWIDDQQPRERRPSNE